MITSQRWTREAREDFMTHNVAAVYEKLTQGYTRALRARELVYAAAG